MARDQRCSPTPHRRGAYRTLYAQDRSPTAGGHAGALVRQYEDDQNSTRADHNARLQLIYAASPRQSPDAGPAPGDPGTSCAARRRERPVVITQLQPMTAIFTIPQDNLRA